MVTFNTQLKPHMSEGALLGLVAQSSEFESMMVREVGGRELVSGFLCRCRAKGSTLLPVSCFSCGTREGRNAFVTVIETRQKARALSRPQQQTPAHGGPRGG